jgi:hypothetical protein
MVVMSALVGASGGKPDRVFAVCVGILIAVVTGMGSVLLLLWATTSSKKSRSRHLRAAVGECLALPTFWFGGPWLSGKLMSDGRLSAALGYYAIALAAGFLLIIGFPLFRLVVRTAAAVRDV